MIRDGLLDSERVQKRSVQARWLYVTILLVADDVGLFEVSHFKLHRSSALDEKVIQKLLDELASADLIRLYASGGKRYGFVPRFGQRLRVKRTKHPLPPEALMVDDEHATNKINGLAEKVLTDVSDAPRGADKLPQTADKCPPEEELEHDQEIDLSLRSRSAESTANQDKSSPKRKRASRAKGEVAPSSAAWNAYSAAYLRRYGVEPVRNKVVNSQLAQFVSRIAIDEAPAVAAFYVGHNGNLYVAARHATNLLVRDAEKLRTDWATNQRTDPQRGSTDETAHHRQQREMHANLSGGRVALQSPQSPKPVKPTQEVLDAIPTDLLG
jgi:hypothetical protein